MWISLAVLISTYDYIPVTRLKRIIGSSKLLALVPLLIPGAPQPTVLVASSPSTPIYIDVSTLIPKRDKPQLPNYFSIRRTSDERLAAEAKAAQEAAEAAESARLAEEAQRQAEAAAIVPAAPVQPTQAYYGDSLSGSYGYSIAWGNCVDEPGVNNPGWGNPSDWGITSTEPWIGASALFWYNHVAVVTGLWSNGDVEVRQQNCPACATRYSRLMLRGYR